MAFRKERIGKIMEKQMKTTRKVRQFGSKAAQTRKVNNFLTIGMTVFYLIVLLNVYMAYQSGIRSVGYTGMMFVLVAIIVLINWIVYTRKPSSDKLKILALAGLCVIDFFITFAFESQYLKYMVLIPFIGVILYYREKVVIGFSIVMCIINTISTVNHIIQAQLTGADRIESVMCLITIIFLLGTASYTTYIGHRFNHDTLYNLQDERAAQNEMMENVLNTASRVRTEALKASEVVDSLDSSTDVVNTAVSEISQSTLSTAENIQEQTIMTQTIQNAIDKTIECSDHMVEVAAASSKAVAENLEVMSNIRQQSKTIADTNKDVAEAMGRLQEKTEQVRNIADVIFNISSQTNLLALNASIESARAGEAGKGFAVVADQIRNLAEETRKETENIAKILEELNINASEAKQAVDNSATATDYQDQLIESASAGFENINDNANKLTEDIKEVERMLADLSTSNGNIVNSVAQLSASTEEVTASSQQAQEISEQNKEEADRAKNALDNVIEISHELDRYMEN